MTGDRPGPYVDREALRRAGRRAAARTSAVVAALRQPVAPSEPAPAYEPVRTAAEYAAEPEARDHVLYYPAPDVASAAERLDRLAADYDKLAESRADDREIVFQLTAADMYRANAQLVRDAATAVRGNPNA